MVLCKGFRGAGIPQWYCGEGKTSLSTFSCRRASVLLSSFLPSSRLLWLQWL
ncbi:unnamed protein product [Chondrus crispus]|uniref:Uncharacterized protein n=1 Tax=Chondrus crispus TaxID=2769 RepID=R7QA72_CHOCR|nr:unnamed protein product [Chondrus crispus]CDF34944.1 unnamed protein product [Chondrus crispus]|eukprot:XP_005714763.1 unnamed protein product [Chondrus crispus]